MFYEGPEKLAGERFYAVEKEILVDEAWKFLGRDVKRESRRGASSDRDGPFLPAFAKARHNSIA